MSGSACARGILLVAILACLFCRPSAAQFEVRANASAPLFPDSLAVGDFNHDGKLDLAVASVDSFSHGKQGYNTNVQVLLGNGDGTFKNAVNYPVGTGPVSVATADLNGDGNLDLVVLSVQTDNFSVLLGLGDGTFLPAVNYGVPSGPIFVAIADFNADGKPDVVTINLSDSTGRCDCVAIFLGNGDGTFQEPAIITTPSVTPFAIRVGYFNSDGHLDLAVAESFGTTDQVEILLGNGDGTFQAGSVYPVCCEPTSIAVADFNGDHKSDLAVAENEGIGIGVLLGNGDGTFRQEPDVPANAPLWVTAADLNGNGKQDLVAANILFPTGVSVLMGNGDGTFQPATLYPVGDTNRFVATADLNGDHKPDIVFAASGTTYVEVLLNTGVVNFSPTTPLSFKKQKAGTTSAPQTVTLINTGTKTLTIASMKTTGQFGMSSTCGSSVTAGADCSISVTFSPKSKGAKAGKVTINDSASSKPQVIELSGTGD